MARENYRPLGLHPAAIGSRLPKRHLTLVATDVCFWPTFAYCEAIHGRESTEIVFSFLPRRAVLAALSKGFSMISNAARSLQSGPTRLSSPPLMNSRRPSTGLRAAISAIALLVASLAAPSAAQLSGGDGSAILMPLNVESVEVEGRFLQNGRPLTANVFDSGNYYLESKEGDPIFIGNSSNFGYGPMQLISGTYEPQVSSFFETATVPRSNRFGFSDPVSLVTDQIFDLDVRAVPVTLTLLMNGATFPISEGNVADFLLRDTVTGREVKIATTLDTGSVIYVVPGTYDVIYEHQSGSLIPANARSVVLEGVAIDEAMPLTIDVPMVLRTFSYVLNGVPFPASGLDFGRIYLEDTSNEESFFVSNTNTQALLRVIPGTYRVIYSFRESQGTVPTNPWAIVDENLVIDSIGLSGIEVEVTSHTVTPVFLMDGLPFPGSGLAYAHIQFRSDNGDFALIGRTHQPPATRVLIEGSYDFYYRLWEPDPSIPANWLIRFEAERLIDETGPLVLNVETATLDLNILLNGEPFPFSGLDFGNIHLVDPETGQDIDLGNSYDAPFLSRIVSGEYDVVYAFQESQGTAPVNLWHTVAHNLQLDGPSSVLTDIRTKRIAPRFSLDGVDFPDENSGDGYARFMLRNEEGDRVWLGQTNYALLDRVIIEGTYQVDYEWQSGSNIPENPRETIATVVVPEPGFAAGASIAMLWIGGLSKRRRQAALLSPAPSQAGGASTL